MKKLVLVVTLISALTLTACGNSATNGNVTDTVASNSITDAVTDAAEDVKEIIEEAESTVTEETEVTDATDEVTEPEVEEEPEEHVCKNAEPIADDAVVDYSATYIDGTRYEIDGPSGYIYLNDEQMFDCDELVLGTKEAGNLCNISSLLDESKLDKNIYVWDDYGYYEYTASNTKYRLWYKDGVLDHVVVSGPAGICINGNKPLSYSDVVSTLGKPYMIQYSSRGYTDEEYWSPESGENYKNYRYVFRVGDFAIVHRLEYTREDLDNIIWYETYIYNLGTYDSIESIFK